MDQLENANELLQHALAILGDLFPAHTKPITDTSAENSKKIREYLRKIDQNMKPGQPGEAEGEGRF